MLSTTGQVAKGHKRIMLVNESAIVRGLITRMRESESGIEVVASVADRRTALSVLPLDELAPSVLTASPEGGAMNPDDLRVPERSRRKPLRAGPDP